MERKTFKATKNTTMPTSGGCTTSPAELMFAIVLAAVDRLVVYKHFLVVNELKATVLSLISGLHVINSFNFPASLVIETSGFFYELYIHLLMDKEFRLEVFFL